MLVASTCRKRLLADIPTDAGPRIAGSTGPRQWVDSLNGEAAGIGSAAHLFADSVNVQPSVVVDAKTRTVRNRLRARRRPRWRGISVDEERYRSGHHDLSVGVEWSGAR